MLRLTYGTSERKIPIKHGYAVYSDVSNPKLSSDLPKHIVCKDFGKTDIGEFPDYIINSNYIEFLLRNFFGASLYFGQIIFFGPEFKFGRIANVQDWIPIYWKMENEVSRMPDGIGVKIGVLNGFEKQYRLWLDAFEVVSIFDENDLKVTSVAISYLENFITNFDKRIYNRYSVNEPECYERAVLNFLNNGQ